MFHPELTVVRFDAEDVITTSGSSGPASLIYVYGFGNDKTANQSTALVNKLAVDQPLLILTDTGKDVTTIYCSDTYQLSPGSYGVPGTNRPILIAETYHTASSLESEGLVDGAYTFDKEKAGMFWYTRQ